ncbi:hypothetical protein CEP54_009126 [Fusarium duplospermum]|uniref:Transcription factor domain-containing protein n=1 Tax=Fusarium duplospermum TaxID=1325734 RepID=A0A428PSA7_9HYPO|nr:hypothetical protein CEP54_009126 [Fusarium duplospermum]
MATSERISRQTKPWHLIKARHESLFNPHQRYWYQNVGYVLGSFLNSAGYTQMSQINILHHFANLVTPHLGSAFRVGLTRWRSFMTDDFTPVQFSWDFHTGSEKPTIRYSMEPIGLDAGTAVNLQNARAVGDFKRGLVEACPEINTTLFDHFRSRFDQLWIGGGPGHQSTMFWGFTLEENTITNKAYFFPGAMARATHQPTLAVIRDAIESAPGYSRGRMASFKLFSDYVSQRPELRLEIEMFAMDLVQEERSKLKVYFRDRRTNFEAVKETMCLGRRLQELNFEIGIQKLRRLWDALLGTQGAPDNIALPYKNHRTAGILYHFEFGMGIQTPNVRVYIPVRHYAENDQQILNALTGFMSEEAGEYGSQAFLESTMRYSECLQSTFDSAALENGLGVQTKISCQYATDPITQGPNDSLQGESGDVGELLGWGDLEAPLAANCTRTSYLEPTDGFVEAPSTLHAGTYTNEQTATGNSGIEINLLASFGIPTAQDPTTQVPTRDPRFESFTWHPPLTWDEMPNTETPIEQTELLNSNHESNPTFTLANLSLDTSFSLGPPSTVSTSMLGNDEDWVKYVYGFPQMMLKAGTYPPFVHPTVYRCSEGEVLEALAIAFCCLGSYNAAMNSSQHFAHSLINKERDQLVKDFPRICSSQSEVWVLASVHAMCIYQIVSFFGQSLEQARNAQLQQPWLLKMTRHLARLHKHANNLSEQNLWEPWALGETIRRTILLVNTINCLSCRVGRQDPYLYEPLDDNLVSNLPLPAPTALWRAKSVTEWETRKFLMADPDLAVSQITLGETLASLLQASRANSLSWDGLDQYTRLVLGTLRFNSHDGMALV